jgi:hypothetical protein
MSILLFLRKYEIECILLPRVIEFKFPDLAREWHPINNGNLLPSQITWSNDKFAEMWKWAHRSKMYNRTGRKVDVRKQNTRPLPFEALLPHKFVPRKTIPRRLARWRGKVVPPTLDFCLLDRKILIELTEDTPAKCGIGAHPRSKMPRTHSKKRARTSRVLHDLAAAGGRIGRQVRLAGSCARRSRSWWPTERARRMCTLSLERTFQRILRMNHFLYFRSGCFMKMYLFCVFVSNTNHVKPHRASPINRRRHVNWLQDNSAAAKLVNSCIMIIFCYLYQGIQIFFLYVLDILSLWVCM